MGKALIVGIDMLIAFTLVGSAVLLTTLNFVETQSSFQNMFQNKKQMLETNIYIQQLERISNTTNKTTSLFYGMQNYTLTKLNTTLNSNNNAYLQRILILNGSAYHLMIR
jgi:hypothetical protein